MTTSKTVSRSPARPFAVVTGAASGIGLELARQFAEHDFDLLIAAEDQGIEAAAADLRSKGATVDTAQVVPETTKAAMHSKQSKPGSGRE